MAVNWQKEPPVESIGEAQVVAMDDMPADTRRGGDVRTLLSPKTVESKSGFMGVATLAPGDRSPSTGTRSRRSSSTACAARSRPTSTTSHARCRAGEALYVPFMMRHRLRNEGDEEAFIVFHLGPLAPRADIGHVDTE